MEPEIIISFIIFVAACWYVCSPLIQERMLSKSASAEGAQIKISDLKQKKEEVLLSLKDLELDYQMKKLSTEDYQSSHEELVKQGAALLKEIDLTKKVSRSSHQTEMKQSQNENVQKFCITCGAKIYPAASFCSNCGKKVVKN